MQAKVIRSSVPYVAICLLLAITSGGCSSAKKQLEASDNLKQLALAAITYDDQHKAWPDTLDQLKPVIGTSSSFGVIGQGKDYATLVKNPLTGDNPGYEYVKPKEGENGTSTIILYQLRDGKRDMSLPVAFADGSVRKADSAAP